MSASNYSDGNESLMEMALKGKRKEMKMNAHLLFRIVDRISGHLNNSNPGWASRSDLRKLFCRNQAPSGMDLTNLLTFYEVDGTKPLGVKMTVWRMRTKPRPDKKSPNRESERGEYFHEKQLYRLLEDLVDANVLEKEGRTRYRCRPDALINLRDFKEPQRTGVHLRYIELAAAKALLAKHYADPQAEIDRWIEESDRVIVEPAQ